MATIFSRNESDKFIKQVGEDFIHNPSGETEDITLEILNVSADKSFNVFSDVACSNLVGDFKVIFRPNDGVYLNLGNITGVELYGDIDYANHIVVSLNGEEKLLDWSELNSDTVINTILRVI